MDITLEQLKAIEANVVAQINHLNGVLDFNRQLQKQLEQKEQKIVEPSISVTESNG